MLRRSAKNMSLSFIDLIKEVKGADRLGVHLSYMRKRPGMYFGCPPFLAPLHNFLWGYEIAEQCHNVRDKHLPKDDFRNWLIIDKGLKDSALGWTGMINEIEPDELKQLHLAIDWFSEFAKINLLDESTL